MIFTLLMNIIIKFYKIRVLINSFNNIYLYKSDNSVSSKKLRSYNDFIKQTINFLLQFFLT